jgi:hypothetical protein
MSIFSNSSHLEWRAGLSDTIVKGTVPRTIPARFGLNWFSGFRGKDLNVIFYQNMPNLHNRYVLYFVIFCSRINHEFENTWGLDTLHLYFFNHTSCDWCINKHLTVIVRSTCKYTHISKHMSYACL